MMPMLLLSRVPVVLVVLLMAFLLAACAAPDPTPTTTVARSPVPSATADAPPTAAPTAPGASPEVTPTPTPMPTIAAQPPPLALELVADGLGEPIGIEPGPAGTLLVQERDGRLVGVDPADGGTWTVVNLSDRVLGGGERGLLGVALHPAWPDDPRAFVHYSDRNGNTVLSSLRAADASAPQPTLDPGSERVLLQVQQPFPNHNGGQLAFGPDGYLWLGLGDGGSGGDPLGHGQNPETLLATILRLDVGDAAATDYAIPSDNPFVDGGGAPEVYHYGLRNPWRFSFDAVGGELFVADVGQRAYEEVNRVALARAGINFGWSVMEGAHCFADPDCEPVGVLPWAEYGHDRGCSVTGGYVYRGTDVDGLWGWYVFSDYCAGEIFGLPVNRTADATTLAPQVLLSTDARITSFGQDRDGELYLADLAAGAIYRIVDAG